MRATSISPSMVNVVANIANARDTCVDGLSTISAFAIRTLLANAFYIVDAIDT